jgi:hypothetical protein
MRQSAKDPVFLLEAGMRARNQSGDERRTDVAAEGFSPELAEQFLRHVMEYEDAPSTTHFRQLQAVGVDLPPPGQLADAQLASTLRTVIAVLARLGVYLSNTNHLSDRELYTSLWAEGLHEEVAVTDREAKLPCTLDMLASGSARDIYLHLKHYADEDYRRSWAEQFPGDEIPPHEDPAFDRDRNLPKATYAASGPASPGTEAPRRRSGGRHNRKNSSG